MRAITSAHGKGSGKGPVAKVGSARNHPGVARRPGLPSTGSCCGIGPRPVACSPVTALAWAAFVCGGWALLRYAVGLPMVVGYFRRARVSSIPAGDTPPLSLLKPLYGQEEELERNLVATLRQNYPDFEVLFLHERDQDPALQAVEAAMRRVPDVAVRTVAGRDAQATNPKVAVLLRGETKARHSILVSADSDVRPDPLYLRDVANGLANADAVSFIPVLFGLRSFASRAIGLVVNTDGLVGGVMLAGRVTTGSTIAVRRDALARIGGYRAVADAIADDYALGRALRKSGCRLALARRAARLHAPASDITSILRWLRTIRSAAPLLYALMLPSTVAPLLLLLTALTGIHVRAALAGLGLLVLARAILALAVDLRFCWDRSLLQSLPLLPLLWLLEPAAWLAGLFGSTVRWRGRRYRLRRGRAKVVAP